MNNHANNLTVQNYGGKGSRTNRIEPTALPTPQAVNSDPRTSNNSCDWRNQILHKAIQQSGGKQYMFLLFDLVKEQIEATDPTLSISRIAQVYLRHSTDSDETIRAAMHDTVKLVAFLAELRSLFQCFDDELSYVALADGDRLEEEQEGGSND